MSSGPLSAIKKFFQKKKADKTFKSAGQGHHLTSPQTGGGGASRPQASSSSSYAYSQQEQQSLRERQGLSTEVRSAADAALLRQATADKPGRPIPGRMRVTTKSSRQEEPGPTSPRVGCASAKRSDHMESSVKFKCDLMPDIVLPKEAMIMQIEQYLNQELGTEPQLAAALMIHTLNKDKAKVQLCIETICKYLNNIVEHPTEEKYRRIRLGNKAFQERVATQKGAMEFMQASGFEVLTIRPPGQEVGEGEDHLQLMEHVAEDPTSLAEIKEVLLAAEPIVPQLDRDVKVFTLKGASANRFGEIPSDFYSLSKEEVARQQQIQKEAVEKMGMLRTKAMRERDEQRELRRYRFTYIRLRFPDNTVLQGTFRASETLADVRAFALESTKLDAVPFRLSTPHAVGAVASLGEENDSMSLAELRLMPASVLNFEYNLEILSQVVKTKKMLWYLKEELLVNTEDLH